MPAEQGQAEILFERVDLHACGAHRDAQRRGGAREVHVLGDGNEYPKTTERQSSKCVPRRSQTALRPSRGPFSFYRERFTPVRSPGNAPGRTTL